MSVKAALAKLSATAAGGALLAGGAVHVAEKPAPLVLGHGKPLHVIVHVRKHGRLNKASGLKSCWNVSTKFEFRTFIFS